MTYREAYKNLKKGKYMAIFYDDVRAYFNDPESVYLHTYHEYVFYLDYSNNDTTEKIVCNTNKRVMIPGNCLLEKNTIRNFSITSFLYRNRIYKMAMDLHTEAVRKSEVARLEREFAIENRRILENRHYILSRAHNAGFISPDREQRDIREIMAEIRRFQLSSNNDISSDFKFLR